MNLDFTRDKYRQLLVSLQTSGYNFITFAEYCKGIRINRFAVLRHDVDLLPDYSLATAKTNRAMSTDFLIWTTIKQMAGTAMS